MQFRIRSLLLFTAVVALAASVPHWWPLDGIVGSFFALGDDDTAYAPGYSERSFRAVRAGMKRNEVYALLGPPIEVRPVPISFDWDTVRQNPGEVVECWTRTPSDSSYRVRQIVFKNDAVVDKCSEYYLD